jgi:phosphatidylserine/phosphatidylglycerophosphate/cardiolipin synthase-like enzyme
VIVEPRDQGSSLVKAIRAAKISVHMTMYLLSSQAVIDALIDRQKAGLDVRVILNQRFNPGLSNNNNDEFATLQAAGVKVVWSPSHFALTHQKSVILDGTTAWIMTMNATTAALKSNREFLAVVTIPGLVADAETVFVGDFVGTPIPTYMGSLVVSPLNAKSTIHNLLSKAKKTIDLEDEEISDADTIAVLKAAAGRGVSVRVVMSDAMVSPAGKIATAELTSSGIPVRIVTKPYIHAKAFVVDGKTAFVGSQNMTHASLASNREMGVVFTAKKAVATVAATIASDFSSTFSKAI